MGKNYSISSRNIEEVKRVIMNQSEPQLCINDSSRNTEPEKILAELLNAFSAILPDRSSFEKDIY